MNSNNKRVVYLTVAVIIIVAILLLLRRCGPGKTKEVVPLQPVEGTLPLTPSPLPTATPTPTPIPTPKPKPKPVAQLPLKVTPTVTATPTPVQIHRELIPKDIEIVRVYYESSITGPGTSIEFDINGSGFNQEFEKMIVVRSGADNVGVQNLKMVTPNQIHGTLNVGAEAKTGVAFPEVLISNKVVFRAPDPFAVIRPGEALNLIFTEMSENGRSGKFRVYTNLTDEMFKLFSVTASTPTIEISDIVPSLPYVVDGTLNVAGTAGGTYAMYVRLGSKTIWKRDDMIRVVRPNVGQTGLVQSVQAVSAYLRPNDTAKCVIYGSGFQPSDAANLKIKIPGFDAVASSITFQSPGRLLLSFQIPAQAAEKTYDIEVLQGTESLATSPKVFMVVPRNWCRSLKADPPLLPGGSSTLVLDGRDLDAEFISSIKSEVDVPNLTVGAFTWVSAERATAPVSAGADIPAGDYWVKLSSKGKPVSPYFGSIIRVEKKQ